MKSSLPSAPLQKTSLASERGDFLPNLCAVQGVLALILVGELLSIVLVIADVGVSGFDWYRFGMISFLMQWVFLASAACLCPMRTWFRSKKAVTAGFVSFAVVMVITTVVSALGQCYFVWVGSTSWSHWALVDHWIIAGIFAGIVLRYFYLRQRLNIEEQAALQAQFQALQSRIRPHFLFNSMNSIASLISIEPARAEQLVVDLADLFRASLKEPGMVELSRELDLCRRFIEIEQVRLGDRLNITWHLPDQLGDIMVPSLMLQPLIENAIYHGIEPLSGGGELVIEVKKLVNQVVFIINNPRFPGDEISGQVRHRSRQTAQHKFKGNGIAIDNIRNRLYAQYGDTASFRIVKGDMDFSVIVRVPYEATPISF